MRPKPNATPDDLAFGINACAMALRTGFVRLVEYLEDSPAERLHEFLAECEQAEVPIRPVPLERLDELTSGGVHQGVLVRLKALPDLSLGELANGGAGSSLVTLLDRVTDPQNLGAIIRTSVAVGTDAVVIPRRRGVQLTPGVHRASAGMSFMARVAAPQNLHLGLTTLKEMGYWVVSAAQGEDSVDATSFDWPEKTALILGSEGEGVGQLLLRESDFRVALPMDPRVESLNVGVAFGSLAYLWRRQWPMGPHNPDSTGKGYESMDESTTGPRNA
jgi:23S rRNA (guanosine2251-2'-O)-methyltransferase